MSTTEKFSNRVSRLREEMGQTQDEFAKTLGVSRNYVSMLENGREPSEALALLVASLEEKHLGTSNRLHEPAAVPYSLPTTNPSTNAASDKVKARLHLTLARVTEDLSSMADAPPERRKELVEMAKTHIDHFAAWLRALL